MKDPISDITASSGVYGLNQVKVFIIDVDKAFQEAQEQYPLRYRITPFDENSYIVILQKSRLKQI